MAKQQAAPGRRAGPLGGWGRLAHARIREVLAAARRDAAVATPDPDRARRLRVALKEVRALLRLLETVPGSDARHARAAARRLRRALSAAREGEALAALAQSLCADLPPGPAAALQAAFQPAIYAAPADQPARRRRRLAPPGRKEWTGATAAGESWRADLQALAAGIEASGDAARRADVPAGMTTTYRRARALGRKAIETRTASDLHAWRTAVSDHRYQLDLIRAASPEAVSVWSKAVRRLRAQLGAFNDLADLAAHPALDVAPQDAKDAILRLIRRRMRKHRRNAFAAHDRLFGERPGDFRRRIIAMLQSAPPVAASPRK